MSWSLESSIALWNRSYLDLRSEEVIAQILDRGELRDWRALYRLAAEDPALRARIHRVVLRVPLAWGHFWLAALGNLGEPIDWSAPLPDEEPGI
ncbi:MAG TPA: hypothetical protein VMT00_15320 [Thermoanaerobaculia bacterium]|nr:hypothetical protein [Thermoanaerobaculia bacterium]